MSEKSNSGAPPSGDHSTSARRRPFRIPDPGGRDSKAGRRRWSGTSIASTESQQSEVGLNRHISSDGAGRKRKPQ
jgi:hypothetical protein